MSATSERQVSFGLVLLVGLGLALGAGAGAGLALRALAPFLGQLTHAALATVAALAGLGLMLALLRPRLRALDWLGLALAPAAIAAGTWLLWEHWHLTLWVDNGSDAAVRVRLAGRELAGVPAGAQQRLLVPRGLAPLETISAAGAVLDRVAQPELLRLELQVVEVPARLDGAIHVLNVGGRHCYQLEEGEYHEREGTTVLSSRPALRVRKGYFATRADFVFAPLPNLITLPVGRGPGGEGLGYPLGVTRHALVVIPCEGR